LTESTRVADFASQINIIFETRCFGLLLC